MSRSRSLTADEREELRQRYTKPDEWPKHKVIEWLRSIGVGSGWDTVINIAAMRRAEGEDWGRVPTLKPAPTPLYTQPTKINEPVVGFLDAHIPLHDARFMTRVTDIAVSWGVRRFLMDTDAMDLDWLSRFERAGDAPDQEQRAYQDVTDGLLEAFEQGDIHAGNHGARIRRTIQNLPKDAQVLFETFLPDATEALFIPKQSKARLCLSDYSYCHVLKETMVGHPSAASLHTALYLAETHRKNVIVGHTHYRSWQWTRDDRYVAVESGMCAHPSKLKYIAARLPARARGKQRQGAVIIMPGDDGRDHIYQLTPHTDWAAMKRMYGGGSVRPAKG